MSIPVSQRRKLRLRDIEELAQGHTASQWQRRDSHPGLCDAAARLIHDAWSEHGTVLFAGLSDGSFHSQPSLLSPPEEGSGRAHVRPPVCACVRMSRIRVIYHPASEEQSLVGEGAPPAHSPSHSAWKFPFLFTISQSLPGLRKDSRKVLTCLTLGHNS